MQNRTKVKMKAGNAMGDRVILGKSKTPFNAVLSKIEISGGKINLQTAGELVTGFKPFPLSFVKVL